MATNGTPGLELLRQQIHQLAAALTEGEQSLSTLLQGIVADVERAHAEPLEIFPVVHHSPASALHMIRRLQQSPPKVIFLELCEDLQPVIAQIKGCRFPIALQAFSAPTEAFPSEVQPLAVVAPITPFSAEQQIMAFCQHFPEIALVCVDRSVDHVFQWNLPKAPVEGSEEEEDEDALHGAAVGVQIGATLPSFDRFVELLLKNAHARSYQEWWDQYVEEVIQGSDLATYKEVMFFWGSLIRRMGVRQKEREIDRMRERYMWTRMKQWLKANNVSPADAMYVCGAAHAGSEVEEFGVGTDRCWEIPPRTQTRWFYGVIPSSFRAIEAQFGHPPGTVALAESRWQKVLTRFSLTPYSFDSKPKVVKAKKGAPPAFMGDPTGLNNLLLRAPPPMAEETDQLVDWCVQIVGKAREHGYLTSSADAIAIYQTSILLANLRNRSHPTPWDFVDAALTCLEKDRVPKRDNIRVLCGKLLGGDRKGFVGYDSLPTLAKDVYDRLAKVGVRVTTQIERILIDFSDRGHSPEKLKDLREGSDLLWKLRYLLGDSVCKPIMGERALGVVNIQESWNVMVGKNQRPLIELAYEGVTVEQVLERRIRKRALAADVRTVAVLEAIEEAILFAGSPRLVNELGNHAIARLREETGGTDAPKIFERIRRLLHYYRSTPEGIPPWLGNFVAEGYQHYSTLLPSAFEDQGTSPAQVAGMLSFLFTLENLALTMGCNRDQLLIAIGQCANITTHPEKLGLLWTAEWLVGGRSLEEIRVFFDEVLENPLRVGALSSYVSGFLLALGFTPLVAGLVVEVLSKAFAHLSERALLTWMPSLLWALRPLASTSVPVLLGEAAARFPNNLKELEHWRPAWEQAPVPQNTQTQVQQSPEAQAARRLLWAHPSTAQAVGTEGHWGALIEAEAAPSAPALPGVAAAQRLLAKHSQSLEALSKA